MADNLTPAQRKRCMSTVRTRGTGIELALATALKSFGLKWVPHDDELPGKPDFVFRRHRVAVFVDGDFWHGFRFPQWKVQVSSFWRRKIDTNRRRDRSVHRKLRRLGWIVLRVWGHEIKRDPQEVAERVFSVVVNSRRRKS